MADEKKLSKEIQFFIVEQLARFRSSKQIIDEVKELFNEILTKQNIYYYSKLCNNPLPENAAKATKALREHFDESRKKFKKDVESIGGFHQPYRMQILQDELDAELAKVYPLKRTPVITDILKQMAEEVGGKYTNRRELTGADGKPLIPVEQMAIALFKNLLNKGLSEDEAADFSAKRYSVDKEKIIRSE